MAAKAAILILPELKLTGYLTNQCPTDETHLGLQIETLHAGFHGSFGKPVTGPA